MDKKCEKPKLVGGYLFETQKKVKPVGAFWVERPKPKRGQIGG